MSSSQISLHPRIKNQPKYLYCLPRTPFNMFRGDDMLRGIILKWNFILIMPPSIFFYFSYANIQDAIFHTIFYLMCALVSISVSFSSLYSCLFDVTNSNVVFYTLTDLHSLFFILQFFISCRLHFYFKLFQNGIALDNLQHTSMPWINH